MADSRIPIYASLEKAIRRFGHPKTFGPLDSLHEHPEQVQRLTTQRWGLQDSEQVCPNKSDQGTPYVLLLRYADSASSAEGKSDIFLQQTDVDSSGLYSMEIPCDLQT